MLNWKIFKKNPTTTQVDPTALKGRSQLAYEFFNRQEHQWIKGHRSLQRCFEWMWESLPEKAIAHLQKISPVLFVYSSGRLSGTYHQAQGQHIILVFPDLLKLLKAADPAWGVVTLIHEMGHILDEHSGRPIEAIEAQVQADRWVIESGFAAELESLLLSLPESAEKRLRLSALTTLVVSSHRFF